MTFSPTRTRESLAEAIRDAGFDVISFASNHCMDWGIDGLVDTCTALRDSQLAVIGAGENLAIARRPAIITNGNTRIAFLARSSILPI